MDISLSSTSTAITDSERARAQHATALAAYGEKEGEKDWRVRVTADAFIQNNAELRVLLQPETGGTVSRREILACMLVAMVTAALVWLPNWSVWPRGPVIETPRAKVPPLLVDKMPVRTRQLAEAFNNNCKADQWTEAWRELIKLCADPKDLLVEPRQALRERLYMIAMNRASKDLDKSSWAPTWIDLDKAEKELFPLPEMAPKLDDEALVASLYLAYLREVQPVLDRGLTGGTPAPAVTRKRLSERGNVVRELQLRRKALSDDLRQRLDLVDAAIHLALVWTMTSKDVDAPVTVLRVPKPTADSETGQWWDRLDKLVEAVETDPSIADRSEWKVLRRGFWLTLYDLSYWYWNPDPHLGSKTYTKKNVDNKWKAAQ